jgi:hypothetical protein
MTDNEKRVERARAAMALYRQEYEDAPICDLIADLLHLLVEEIAEDRRACIEAGGVSEFEDPITEANLCIGRAFDAFETEFTEAAE